MKTTMSFILISYFLVLNLSFGNDFLEEISSHESIIFAKFIQDDEFQGYVIVDIIKGSIDKNKFNELKLRPKMEPVLGTSFVIFCIDNLNKKNESTEVIGIRKNLYLAPDISRYDEGFSLVQLYRYLNLSEDNHKIPNFLQSQLAIPAKN
ncbi:MAG: hypothetical protein ABJQ29_13325 [Luteolibacter sp.]